MRIEDNFINEFFNDTESGNTQEYKSMDKDTNNDISVLKEKAENGDVDAQLSLGKYYHRKNNYKLAVEYYRLAAEKNNKEAVRLMVDLYMKSNDFDKAIQCYKKLESIDGKSKDFEIGKALLEKGKESMALEYLNKAAENGSRAASKILESLGSVPDIKLLEEKAQLHKDRHAALALAEYYYGSDSYLSAFWYHFAYTHNYVYPLITEQIKGIFGTPCYGEDRLMRIKENNNGGQYAIIEKNISRIHIEIEQLEQSLKSNNDSSFFIELGDKYASLGKHAQALTKYKMAIDEGLKDAYLKIAEVYMRSGDFYNGMHWLKKSALHNDANAYRYLANIYKEMNDEENMLKCYLKLLELGDMSICSHLAKLYEERMELPESISYYKRCIIGAIPDTKCMDFGHSNLNIDNIKNKILTLEKLYSLSTDPIERLEKIFNTYKKYSSFAAIKLANAFYEGHGVRKDYKKSAYWYKQVNNSTIVLQHL